MSSSKGKVLMAQMGMFNNMAEMEDAIYGDDDDDLEAELLALQAEDSPKQSPKKSATSNNLGVQQSNMKKIPSGLLQLDKMVAESMQDVDDNVSDTEDPELEAELLGLEEETYEPPAKTVSVDPAPRSNNSSSVMTVLKERLAMYELAHNNAVSAGDTSKSKRLDRGIKALKDQIKKASAGKPVPEEDIPPPVATGSTKASLPPAQPEQPKKSYEPTLPASQPQPSKTPSKSDFTASYSAPKHLNAKDAEIHQMLALRQNQFKMAALDAKHRGNAAQASSYLKTYKKFDAVIKAVENNQPVDLQLMPPPPPGFQAPEIKLERDSHQTAVSPAKETEEEIPQTNEEEKKKIYSAPETPSSTMEALDQRLKKYTEAERSAKAEGNGSKARRMGRIVKQYEDAIKLTKAGKPYAYEDLPAPPGFPPIPQPSSAGAVGGGQAEAAPTRPTPQPATSAPTNPVKPSIKPSSSQSAPVKTKALQRQTSALSRCEQQTLFLQERQLQFKKAALKAKNTGDVELAKKYLRQAKGFDQMIEALQSGLPVNLSSIPKAPDGADEQLEFVSKTDKSQPDGNRDEMYKKLEQELINQIKTADTNGDHFTKLGDVSTASKFVKLCQSARKDLDALKNAYTHGDPVPRFHYENKSFSMVQSCTDLADNDLDICIIRGINYNLPSGFKESDMDTYIKYEFPFPKDTPQKGESSVCKGTNCPEYNQSFKVNIERKSRVFSRILNSKSLKIDVFYRRGFFKGDKLLGTASVRLQPLENICVYHESHDLMDGRKAAGGKLEVKLRVRNPFVGKQVEEVKEKWLIIDQFDRAMSSQQAQKTLPAASNQKSKGSIEGSSSGLNDVTSMEVLKYEKQLLEQQVKKYQGKLKESELDAMQHKGTLLDRRIAQIREQIKKGGVRGLKEYATAIEKTQNQYLQEAKVLVQQGNRDKAQILMTKKKIVEKEVENIMEKLRS